MKNVAFLVMIFFSIFWLKGVAVAQQANPGQKDTSITIPLQYSDKSAEEIKMIVDSLVTKYEAHCWRRIYCNCERRNPYRVDATRESSTWNLKQKTLREYIENLEIASSLATSINYSLGIARAELYASWIYFELVFLDGTFDENEPEYLKGIASVEKSIELYRESGFTYGQAAAYGHLASYYFYLDKYPDKFAEAWAKCVELHSSINSWEEIAFGSQLWAMRSFEYQRYEQAISFYRTMLAVRKKQGKKIDIAWSMSLIGDYHMKVTQNYDSASYYYHNALDLAESSENKMFTSHNIYNPGNVYSYILNGLGALYLQKESLQKAGELLQQANKIALNEKDTMRLAPVSANLGSLYKKLDSPEKAIEYFNKSLYYLESAPVYFFENSSKELKLKIWRDMSGIYESIGDYQNALLYYQTYSNNIVQMLTEAYDEDIAEYHVAYETADKEIENELLKRDNIIKELKLKQRNRGFLILILATLVLVIFVIVVLYRYRLKAKIAKMLKEQVNEAIEKHKEQQQIIVHQAGLTSLGEMAAGIAHEAKVPIQNILFAAESLQMEQSRGFKDKEYTEKMIREIFVDVDKLNKLIEHIQTFSSHQKTELEEEFSINEAIQSALSMMKIKLVNQGIDLKLELEKNPPRVSGNTYKFEQVIINLLNNARDAIEDKYTKMPREEKKTIKVKTFTENQSLVTEVTDNGIGIREEDRMKIFNPFFTTKELGKGTGLGLSISYGLIREMNGTIHVMSKFNEGTSFKISLPL